MSSSPGDFDVDGGLVPMWGSELPAAERGHRPAARVGEPTSQVPFTVIDEALHRLDTPSEAGSIQLELRVAGHLDETRLRAAVTEGLAHHPMARARMVAGTGTGSHEWEITAVPDVDPFRALDCADDDALAAARRDLQGFSVPLVESPPLRVRLARHPHGDAVMLNVNHAAFDGFGCLSVLRSIARAYAGRPDRPGPVDLAHARNLSLGATPEHPRLAGLRGLVGKAREVASPPARLEPVGGTEDLGYGFRLVSLSGPATELITSPPPPTSTDDVLVAAMHMAIVRWNTDHGGGRRRVSVQVDRNLRQDDWAHDVATNCVVPTQVVTEAEHWTSPRATLEEVTAQRLSWAAGQSTVGPHRAAGPEANGDQGSPPMPLVVPTSPLLRLAASRLADTAVVSTLGRVDDPIGFGPDAGQILELWFSAPARMPGGLSLGAVVAAGRMHLSFRYRHPLFGEDAAVRFVDSYLAELDSLVSGLSS